MRTQALQSPARTRKKAAAAPSPLAAQNAPAPAWLYAPQVPQGRGACACGGGCPRCAGSGAASGAASGAGLQPVQETLRAAGQPLPAPVRAEMEAQFQQNFSPVRVHNDPRAAESARGLRASAYTVGNDVVFGPGQYQPGTPRGRRLLAHELTHVVQQSRAAPVGGLTVQPADGIQESQARRAGLGLNLPGAGGQATPLARQSVQRQADSGAADDEASLSVGERLRRVAIQRAAQQTAQAMRSSLAVPIPEPILAAMIAAETSFLLRGYERLVTQGGGLRFLGRVSELLDFGTAVEFVGRYLWGLLKGLVSPITGLVQLAIGAVQFQAAAIGWITQRALHAPELLREAQGLEQDFRNFANSFERSRRTLLRRDNLIAFASAMFSAASAAAGSFEQTLVAAGERKGREAADSLVDSLLTTPLPQLAEIAGEIIGTVVIELILLLFTDGIGNLITKLGEFAETLRPLSRGVAYFGEVAASVGRVITEVEHVVGAFLNRTVLRPLQPLFEALEPLLARMRRFVSGLLGLGEGAATRVAGAGARATEDVLESGGRAAEHAVPTPRVTTTRPPLRSVPGEGLGDRIPRGQLRDVSAPPTTRPAPRLEAEAQPLPQSLERPLQATGTEGPLTGGTTRPRLTAVEGERGAALGETRQPTTVASSGRGGGSPPEPTRATTGGTRSSESGGASGRRTRPQASERSSATGEGEGSRTRRPPTAPAAPRNLRTFQEDFHFPGQQSEQERIMQLARRNPVQAGQEYEALVRRELGNPPYGERILTPGGGASYRIPDYPAPGEITIQGRWVTFSDGKMAQLRAFLGEPGTRSLMLTMPRIDPAARAALEQLAGEYPNVLIVVRETWARYATSLPVP